MIIIKYDEDEMPYEYDTDCKCNIDNCVCYDKEYECCAIANYDCVAKMDMENEGK